MGMKGIVIMADTDIDLSIEERNLALETERLETEKERLRMDQKRLKIESRHWYRLLPTVPTTLVSVAVVVGSYLISTSQTEVATLQKQKELQLSQGQRDEDRRLAQEQADRDWGLKLFTFVNANQKKIFSPLREERQAIQKIMLGTFPPSVTEKLFKQLSLSTKDTAVVKDWNAAQVQSLRIERATLERLDSGTTSATIPASTNFYRVDLSKGGGQVFTLPPAKTAGQMLWIRLTKAAPSGTITIQGAGSDLIDNGSGTGVGSLSVQATISGTKWRLVSDGSGYWYQW